jgi:hypothetical protein
MPSRFSLSPLSFPLALFALIHFTPYFLLRLYDLRLRFILSGLKMGKQRKYLVLAPLAASTASGWDTTAATPVCA